MPYTLTSYSDPKLLVALAFITPIVGVIAPLQIATVAVMAAVVVVVFRIINKGPWPFSAPKIILVLIATVVWGSISCIWAIEPDLSISAAARLALAATSLVILLDASQTIDAEKKKSLYKWSSYGAMVGIGLVLSYLSYIYLDNAWDEIKGAVNSLNRMETTVNSLNRSASFISIFAWPWALSISRQYGARGAITFIPAIIVTLYLLAPITPVLAFFVGACAFAVAWVSPRWAKVLLLIMMILCVGTIPFLNWILPYLADCLHQNFPGLISTIHRFVIWQFVSDQILVKPIIGWGLDSARVFPNGDANLFLFEGLSGQPITGRALPLHPHNAMIQIWLELGFIGVLLFFTLIVFAIKGIPSDESRKADPAVGLATIATALVIAQLGYGFWQGWWLATLGLAAVTTASLTRKAGLQK